MRLKMIHVVVQYALKEMTGQMQPVRHPEHQAMLASTIQSEIWREAFTRMAR